MRLVNYNFNKYISECSVSKKVIYKKFSERICEQI